MDNSTAKSSFFIRLFSSDIYQEVKACFALALPLSLAQLIELSMVTVDTWTMGLMGSEALAGGALGYITFRFAYAIGLRVLSAVNTVSSIAFGEKQLNKLSTIVTQGFYVSLILAVPMMVILALNSQWMVFLGQEKANIISSQLYLQAILWGLPALFGFEVLRNVLTAINHPKIITIIALFNVFLNAGANYVLAFGKLGFPALGLAGIGWATTMVLWFELFAAILFILLNPQFKKYQIFQGVFRFDKTTFQEILNIGLPSGVHYLSGGGYQVVIVYLFGYFGSISLAAFQIANQVNLLIRDIIWGLGQAIIARVGQMYGKGSLSGVRRAGFVGISLGILVTIGYICIVIIGREQIVSIFLHPQTDTDIEVFQLATKFVVVIALMQVFNEIDTTSLGALRGIKDTTIPMIIGIFSYWVVGVGSAYLLAFHWHLEAIGLLIGFYLAMSVTAILLPLRFYIRTGNLDFPSSTKR